MARLKRNPGRMARTLLLCCLVFGSVSVCGTRASAWVAPLDYIIVCHNSLNGPALQAFLNHRFGSEQGRYILELVNDTDNRDWIQSMVRSDYTTGDYSPLYILLIGSAKRDCAGLDGQAGSPENNLVPTMYFTDAFGTRAGYDQWYTYLDSQDDRVRRPCAIIGRIPARSEVELQNYVNKLIQYEESEWYPDWKSRALLVSGDVYRGPFPLYPSPVEVNDQIDALADSLPLGLTSTVLRHSSYGSYAAREQAFVNALNTGQGLIAALTTASNAAMMGWIIERPQFDAAVDLASQANDWKYPVMFAASCNLGEFDWDIDSTEEALAENLLLAPSRGVVGIVGPSGFSSNLSNYPFLVESFDNIMKRGMTHLGEAAMGAVVRLREAGYGICDTYDMMSILGDPGLKIDLSVVTRTQKPSWFEGDMELTSPVPLQNRIYLGGIGLDSKKAGVVKRDQVLGRRSYRIEGFDKPTGDPTTYWTVFELGDFGMTVDSTTARFLTYWVRGEAHPEDVGRFGIDCLMQDETLLSAATNPTFVDQYGTQMAPIYRHTPVGYDWFSTKFYAFDLKGAHGRTIRKILAGYDAASDGSSGQFRAVFDEIKLSATWGFPPTLSPIEMPTNVIKNSTVEASVSADDQDIMSYGDGLSYFWSATHGAFTGTGPFVEYHAPDTAFASVLVRVRVSDKGGHVDSASKTISISGNPPSGCPHLFVWSGGGYVDQGAVLTRSRFDASSVVPDAQPILVKPTAVGNAVRLALKEEGNDVTSLEKIALTLVKVSGDPADRVGIRTDGRILRAVQPLAPFWCEDDHRFVRLSELASRDGTRYSAFGPGYLVVSYSGLPPAGLPKLGESYTSGGGGPSIEDPPKEQWKVAVHHSEPVEPNYVSVSILSPIQEWWDEDPDEDWPDHLRWDEVARLAPESKAGLPELVDLLPYVNSRGELCIKIAWTWSFSADDLCFYRFSDSGIVQRDVALSGARHNTSGSVIGSLLDEDGRRATLSPGQEIVLDFPAVTPDLYDFAVMRFWGRYDPVGKGGQSVSGPSAPIPTEVRLAQNFPNPFNAGTVINYDLPDDGPVTLEVFDILGRHVATLVNEDRLAGQHTVAWDGRDDRGSAVASGVYFYRLSAQGLSQSKKMILIK